MIGRNRRGGALALLGCVAAGSILLSSPALAEADPQFLNDRAARAIKAGDVDAGLADLNESLRIKPGQAVALLNRGVAYAQKGKFELARADYDASIAIDPIYPAYTSRGSLFAKTGQYERAIEDYRAALKLQPLSSLTLLNLAVVYKAMGRYDEALETAEHSYKLKTEPKAQVLKGEILTQTGDYAGAVKAFTRAIVTVRTYATAYALRSFAYTRLGQYDLAMADIDKAVALEPNNSDRLNTRCWYRGMAGRDLPSALEDCNRALSIGPISHAMLHSRALVYAQAGDQAAAMADIDRGLSLAPDDPDLLFLRGVVKLKQGQEAGARADMERALSLQPKVARDYQQVGLPAWALATAGQP